MDYRKIVPIQGLVELNDPKNLEDFINQIINMYFKATDVRTKESCYQSIWLSEIITQVI